MADINKNTDNTVDILSDLGIINDTVSTSNKDEVLKEQAKFNDKIKKFDGLVLGIDFGTSNSVVSVIDKNGEEVVIPTGMTGNVIPSVVFYENTSRVVVGEEAKAQIGLFPNRTIRSIKRILGKTIDDPDVKEYIAPYDVTFNEDENRFYFNVLGKKISAEEVASEIFKKIKQIAEDFLGMECPMAVITVPANYTKFQREAIKDSAELAGLEVIRMINEPTAAALAYGIKGDKDGKYYGVYDLGGGTFDITILKLLENEIKVLSTDGDINLGGNDFDNAIAQYFLYNGIEEKISDFSIEKYPGLWQELIEQSEVIKKDLSIKTKSYGNVIYNGEQYELELDRNRAGKIVEDLIQRTITITNRALIQAKLDKEDISKIILVGGMTNMPAIRNALEKEFGAGKIEFGIDPFKTVSIGAAYQGAMMQGRIKSSTLGDVVPVSLGIETRDGGFEPILEKNTPIDAVKSKIFTTSQDDQEYILIEIFQGERPVAKLNQSLGYFQFQIPPKPTGSIQVEVSFKLNEDGILEIVAKNMENNEIFETQVNTFKSFSRIDVKKLREESSRQAKLNAAQDLKFSVYLDELTLGYNILNKAKKLAIETGTKVIEYQKSNRYKLVASTPGWVNEYKKLSSDLLTEIEGLQKELDSGAEIFQTITPSNEKEIVKTIDKTANEIRKRISYINSLLQEKSKIDEIASKSAPVKKVQKTEKNANDFSKELQIVKKGLQNSDKKLTLNKENKTVEIKTSPISTIKNEDIQKIKSKLDKEDKDAKKVLEKNKKQKSVELKTGNIELSKSNKEESDGKSGNNVAFFNKLFPFLKNNKKNDDVHKLEIKELINTNKQEIEKEKNSNKIELQKSTNKITKQSKFLLMGLGDSKLKLKIPENIKSAFFVEKANAIILVDDKNNKYKLSEGKTVAMLYLGGSLPFNIVKEYRKDIINNLTTKQLETPKSVKVKTGDKIITLNYKIKDCIFNDNGLKTMDLYTGKISNIKI